MIALLCFLLTLLTSPFRSKSRLEAENAALRHQLIVLQRRVAGSTLWSEANPFAGAIDRGLADATARH